MKLITDRTQTDVDNINIDSSTTSKGAYNYTDLNRVETKVKELNEYLKTYNYMTETLSTKLDWAMTDKFNQSNNNNNRYLSNLRKIRQALATIPTTPQVPSTMANLTYDKANDIEKMLIDIEMLIHGLENYQVFSGVSNSGQVRLYQNRFRHFYEYTDFNISTWGDFSNETWADLEDITWGDFE